MKDATARTVSTAAIWLAVAVVLALGVFQRTWNGDSALLLLGMVVLVVCGSALGGTLAVWRGASAGGRRTDTPPPDDS